MSSNHTSSPSIDPVPVGQRGAVVADSVGEEEVSTQGVRRFAGVAATGLGALLIAGVPFLVLMALVQAEWGPLIELDDSVAAGLNTVFSQLPLAVTVLEYITELGGGATTGYIMAIAVAFLLVRRQYGVAAYLAATGIGLAVLAPVMKVYVDRMRPDVADPVSELPTNASFPSGHAMTAMIVWGALALVALPLVRPSRRTPLVVAAVGFIVLTGFTRLALGVHFLSDVIAGWALGALWLAIMTLAFRRWLRDRHEQVATVGAGEQPSLGLRLAPVEEPAVPRPGRAALLLTGAGALLSMLLIGAGLALVAASDRSAVKAWDERVTDTVLDTATPALENAATSASALTNTWGLVAVVIAAAMLGLALRGSWRPVAFVLVSVGGYLVIYAITSQIVGRERPADTDYTSGLPQGASFPSGHVAAVAAGYGALATIAITYLRSRWRWAVLAPLVVAAVAVMGSRVALGAHHVLDVVAGLALGTAWLLVARRVILAPSHD